MMSLPTRNSPLDLNNDPASNSSISESTHKMTQLFDADAIMNSLLDGPSDQLWRFVTGVKDIIPEASRLENRSWRLMHVKNRRKDKEAPSSPITTTTSNPMDIPSQPLTITPHSLPNYPIIIDSLESYGTSPCSYHDKSICSNCSTTSTSLWRKSPLDGTTWCNACCLYYKLHHKMRSADMRTDNVRRRNRTKKSKMKNSTSLADASCRMPVEYNPSPRPWPSSSSTLNTPQQDMLDIFQMDFFQ